MNSPDYHYGSTYFVNRPGETLNENDINRISKLFGYNLGGTQADQINVIRNKLGFTGVVDRIYFETDELIAILKHFDIPNYLPKHDQINLLKNKLNSVISSPPSSPNPCPISPGRSPINSSSRSPINSTRSPINSTRSPINSSSRSPINSSSRSPINSFPRSPNEYMVTLPPTVNPVSIYTNQESTKFSLSELQRLAQLLQVSDNGSESTIIKNIQAIL